MIPKLSQIIDAHSGKLSDKWSIYISEYEKLFKEFMDKEINYLEIGVQNGGFLEIISKYFEKAKIILGIDINPDCDKLIFEDSRISVIVGDANDKKIIRDIERKNLTFNIIVDDGSHTSKDIILAFSNFFPNLKTDGIYIVEDLHCSYWQEFQGGLYDHTSSLSFFKKLIDLINNEHWGIEKSSRKFLEYFENKYSIELNFDCFEDIHSIEFINSLCVIRKNNSNNNILGKRRVSGIHEIVEGHLALNGMDPIALSQEFNPTSKRIFEVEDEIVLLKNKINQDTLIIQQLQEGIGSRDQSIQQLQEGISSRDQSIQQLQEGIGSRDQSIQQLQEGIGSRDQSIQQLQEGIGSRDQSIQQLQEGIGSRDQQIEVLTNSISNIYKSTSWKLSHPIRFVGHQLKRVKVIYKALPEILIRGGGFRKSLSKAFKVYKNGGIRQVRSTLKFVLTSSSNTTFTTESGEIVDRNDYQEWIKRYDTLTPEICAKIQDKILEFTNTPKISIVMPVYDPPLQFLDEAIWSVRNQLYQNWELCIADDCSKNEEVRVLLRKHASEDHRIKVVYREENGHISRASNSALDLATGEFVGLLDHDDILPIHALYKVVKTILQNPNVSLIYSDEDKIDNKGRRSNPYFKSDWNIEMQYSHNMFSHFGVYKRSILEEIQGFRIGLEGSQDYDLLLRCIEKVEEKNILHIPHVLYHWRIHSNSTAMSSDTKPYAMVAGEKALNEHFVRIGINGRVKLVDYGYSLHFNLPSNVPMVTIVIPTRNSKDLVIKCIHSIRQLTNYPSFEIILVDNGSDELDSLQEWKKLAEEGVCIIRDDSPFNYSALNNLAVAHAKGEVIVMLNNDTEVIDPKWLDILVSNAIRPGVGAVGARLLFPNQTIQHAGVVLGLGGAAGHVNIGLPAQHYGYFGKVQLASSFSAVTGACLAVRKELYELIGGLDEKNLPVSFNDVDFCLRLNSEGYRTVYAPNALLFHHESASRGPEDNEEKIKRFDESVTFMYKKWGKLIRNDPFYNPNLTLEFPDYSLAFPPRIKMV